MKINKKEGVGKMPRVREDERLKLDNAVVELLWKHKGKENAVPSNEIGALLKGLNTSGYGYCTAVPILVRRLMIERRLPICHCRGGYYWARTKEELVDSVADLKKRLETMRETVEHLESFIF